MKKNFIARCADVIKKKGVLGFIKQVNIRHFDPLKVIFHPYANIKISSDIQQSFNAEKSINFIFNKYGGYLRPLQWKSEILNLAIIAEEKKPKIIVEIGVYTGGTFFTWARLGTSDAHLVGIDLLEGGSNNWAFPKWKEPFYKKFASPGQKVDIIRANSQIPETAAKLKEMLAGEQIDFLFIDADHTYEGVKRDYELYSPLVKKGGIIAFHDIVQFPEYTNVKVKQLWDEIKVGKNYKEFIENPNQLWGGIGIIFV